MTIKFQHRHGGYDVVSKALHSYKQCHAKNETYAYVYFSAFYAGIFLIAFYNKYSRLDIAFIIFILVVCALWVIFIPKFFEKTSLKKAKKLLMKPENSIMFGQFEILLPTMRLMLKTPNTATNLQWNEVQSVDETDEYVIFTCPRVCLHYTQKENK